MIQFFATSPCFVIVTAAKDYKSKRELFSNLLNKVLKFLPHKSLYSKDIFKLLLQIESSNDAMISHQLKFYDVLLNKKIMQKTACFSKKPKATCGDIYVTVNKI